MLHRLSTWALTLAFCVTAIIDCASSSEFEVVYPLGAKKIASDFHSIWGVDKMRKRDKKHQGIDITGENNDPIIAAADGVVLESVIEKCWGPTIAIDHGKDIEGKDMIALYGHVGERLVATGDDVKRGQIIAFLGNNHKKFRCISGVRHLHFQIGRKYRWGFEKGSSWGHSYFLKDGGRGVNPHLHWADGPGQVTCFDPNRIFEKGSLTYPIPCDN